jgi:RES domain-containing protein
VTAPSPVSARVEAAVQPYGGLVYCHVPASSPFAVDALAKRDDGHDRWGTPGEKTVFLASDPAIAVVEFARHREPGSPDDERRLMRLRLRAVTVLDVRQAPVAEAVGMPSPGLVVDRELARRIAADVRFTGICQGLIVPSAGFVDRLDRTNVILFAEHLGRDLSDILSEPEEVGRISVAGG